jgi:predicted dehydrogenase/threonine dehydrogenase-like Zn-dependent dehydrogenase
MKQLSQNLRTGKLSIDQVPAPAVMAGQVQVQLAYSLISAGTERTKIETGKKSLVGKAMSRPDQVQQVLRSVRQAGLQSTFQKVKTRLDARSPLGYSSAGVVVAAGEGVNDFKVGDRVACAGTTASHAEMVTVPTNLCVHVPGGVDLKDAAFTTVGAIALQGVRQADVRLGEVVVVTGLGLVGVLTVQMLRAAGCVVLGFDPNPQRCKLAEDLGAHAAFDSEGALNARLLLDTGNNGADAVILTAGTHSNRPVEMAGEICRDKGRVVVVGAVGLTVPRAPYYEKELELRLSRSYGPGRYDPNYEEKGLDYPYGYVRWTEKRNMQAFLRMVSEKQINLKQLITHAFKLGEADEAYELISGKKGILYLGVLFEYDLDQVSQDRVIVMRSIRPAKVDQIGVGVIGAGNFAQSMLLPHLQAASNVDLIGVATLSPLQTKDVAERFGFQLAASTEHEIIENEHVNGVVIATRHDSHASLVLNSLHAGKAVHVEKPLCLKRDELDKIVDAYQAFEKAFLMVGFNRRFAPLVQQMTEFFANRIEPLAMTYRINAGYIPLDHWTQDPQQGGGRILGEVCHFIDLLQYFAGATVKSVGARAMPNQGKYINDNLAVVVELSDGSIGNILYTANGDKALPKEYLEVYCGGKIAILNDFRSVKLISGGKNKSIKNMGQDKGHKNEMLAWVRAIQKGEAEPIPFVDTVAATRAAFAVIDSLTSGQFIIL